MATDFLGKRIDVGDTVVFMQINYRGLVRGVIKKLTPKKAVIIHDRLNVGGTESTQFHDQMIVISD
jgi:hypothetical protein